jgi:transposase
MANKNQTWSYFLYDSNMTLIKEINSTISKEYNQNYFKETANNQIECFFNIDNLSKKDCVFQIINLN